MDWNKKNVGYLKEVLQKNRENALRKGKMKKATAFEIIDFLAKNPVTVFSGAELAARFGLPSTTSLGGHLKAQNKVMVELGMDKTIRHSWFVDWKEASPTWNYWLSAEKSDKWNNS